MNTEKQVLVSSVGQLIRPANRSATPDAPVVSAPLSRVLWPFRDPCFGLGLILLALSALLYAAHDLMTDGIANDPDFALFFGHYAISVIYSSVLLVNGLLRWAWWRREQPNQSVRAQPARWIALVLWLLSAFALNREVVVFQISTTWLQVALVLASGSMVLYAWKEQLPVRGQQALYVVLAGAWWLFGYAAIYVSEIYPISVLGLVALGMSIHTFVPLLFVISLSKRLWQDYRRDEHLRPAIWLGLTLPVLITGLFLAGWGRVAARIDAARSQAVLRQTTDLPDWVLMGQAMPTRWPWDRWLLYRLLQTGTVYDEGPFSGRSTGLGNLTNADDARQHDPLVVLASRLLPVGNLTGPERTNLLNLLRQDARHATEEKFWSGRNLTTEHITTQARIWPQFRVAYTETTLRIRNQAERTTQEALYTLVLPEGSAVSSLSLWINGREEPGRLTTVAKADSAYRQVVNVESRPALRDPAVVYWQEGNRVTVRVFPCPARQDRQVKLGVTSPLRYADGQLSYERPQLIGPDASDAEETIQLDFDQPPTQLQMPGFFEQDSPTRLTYSGSQQSDAVSAWGWLQLPVLGQVTVGRTGWPVRFNAPALSTAPFRLGGSVYRVAAYQPKPQAFRPTDVYLDVNAAWADYEIDSAFWGAYKDDKRQRPYPNRRIWAFDDGLVQLTPTNYESVLKKLRKQAFSIFPVYRVAHPETALLITKGTGTAPTLSDLKNTRFAERMTGPARQPIRTFCYNRMGANGWESTLSPYLKTLAELRVLDVMPGITCDLLHTVFPKNQFTGLTEAPDAVALPSAGIQLVRQAVAAQPAPAQPTAPDHLARLYAYNHLLRGIGRQYLDGAYQRSNTLLAEAQQAHVLSPLTSLIVLESQADYDRFGIKHDLSGLDNATLKQDGAVPEPHEWAMLVLLLVGAGWLYWRQRVALR